MGWYAQPDTLDMARGAKGRCPSCYWALYDGAWCQNKDCPNHGETIPKSQQVGMTNEEAAEAIAAKNP